MSEMINEMTGAAYALASGYCLQYFLGEFLESRLPGRKRNGLTVAALYGVLRIGINFFLPFCNESLPIVCKQLFIVIVLSALTFCFYRASRGIAFFLVITFMAVSEISFFLSYMIIQAGGGLFDLWNFCFEKGYIRSADTLLRIVYLTAYSLQAMVCAANVLILYFFLKKLADSYSSKDQELHRTELLFVTAPGLAGLLICTLLRMIMITVENGEIKLLYDKYPLLLAIVPAILCLLLLSILYSVRLFQDIKTLNRERSGRIILEKQIESMQEHMAEMEHVYGGMRSMRHDMKNTLAVVMQLAAGDANRDKLHDYLAALSETMDRLELRFQTGNSVADALLTMKCREAERDLPDLKWETERLIFPTGLLIHSFDIGAILGNALDNAVEACRKLKEKDAEVEIFIRLRTFQKGRMFFIEAENSFDGMLIRKPQAEFPATDKADREAHGIGLANIKKAAEKYHGAVDWSAEHHVFTLSVMMQNEGRGQDER